MSGNYWNSSFKQKLKICRLCGLPKIIFSHGRCKACAQRQDAKPIGTATRTRPPKMMRTWFEEHRELMTGICAHCGGPSSAHDDQRYTFSICHILPKRKDMFPSVENHPDNWIELCYWAPSCHDNFDNGTLDLIDMHCFDTIIERFLKMYPVLTDVERARIPETLMKYVHIDI